ncbi:MAG: O-methyltransferase [Bacteriovoracia bacterium]
MDKSYSAQFGEKSSAIMNLLTEIFHPEDPTLAKIRENGETAGLPAIQVGRFDALHLEVLARAFNTVKAVEIGTLGGYSGTAIARALPSHGLLHTFEFEPKHADVAQASFKLAGVEKRVRIHVGPALENLPKIEAEGPFDLVFVDADKVNYPNYLEWAARNLRPGGVLLGDNAYAWGLLADTRFQDPEREAAATALRKFAKTAAQDGRFRATILPTGEGLLLAVRT